jgi:hypothetical protein
MNGWPFGRNENRLRKKQQEPCASDNAVRYRQGEVSDVELRSRRHNLIAMGFVVSMALLVRSTERASPPQSDNERSPRDNCVVKPAAATARGDNGAYIARLGSLGLRFAYRSLMTSAQ